MVANFFDTVVPKFQAALPKDGQIPSAEFCDAADAIIKIFDALSGMGAVQSDMGGNATYVRKKMAEFENMTIQGMCEAELASVDGKLSKVVTKTGSMCCSLLWLKRALRMIEGCAWLARASTPPSPFPAAE